MTMVDDVPTCVKKFLSQLHKDKDDILASIHTTNDRFVHEVFRDVLEHLLHRQDFKSKAVWLDVISGDIKRLNVLKDCYLWEKVNVGHWKDVSETLRKAFYFGSFLKAVLLCLNCSNVETVIKELDLAMIMGAPILDNIALKVCSELSEVLIQQTNMSSSALVINDNQPHTDSVITETLENSSNDLNVKDSVPLPQFVGCFEIRSFRNPSLNTFASFFMKKEPLLIHECISHWPAVQKWNTSYIKKVAGFRTLPVEIGSKYTSEEWTQKLMTVNEFIEKYMSDSAAIPNSRMGYIAQYNLFEQIQILKQDIRIPDYCAVGETEDPEINAWFGPGNTISPTHYDPKDNILVQIFGSKLLRLFPPSESELLCPYPSSSLLFNTSQIDLDSKNVIKDFPNLAKARYCEFKLNPGDAVYIPKKWWHYVRSLSPSFSVSYWFE